METAVFSRLRRFPNSKIINRHSAIDNLVNGKVFHLENSVSKA